MQYNPNPPMTLSTVPMLNPSNMYSNPMMHLLTRIPSSVSLKLTVGGIFYIILGLVAIGLDIGIIVNALTSFGGIINGVYLFTTGILILHLCRHEVKQVAKNRIHLLTFAPSIHDLIHRHLLYNMEEEQT
ncbi:unnamed protein product [Rotaria sordida]|uniref:Uncharacterized protein n=1 Tax=Rotaria sordida TaxID=392033 RepID=A0A813Y5G8_9BILA|nr:unnamed protein product [Rotaria sordida]